MRWRSTLVQSALILAAVLLLYLRTLDYGLVGFDDSLLLLENQEFLSDFSNVPSAFKRDIFSVSTHGSSKAYYRPLLTLSFMIDAQFGDAGEKVYRVTNIALHGSVCLIVFWFLWIFGMKRETAFLLTLLFAVHPMLSQAVAWIPGRNDPLLALYVLPSMGCLVLYSRSDEHWLLGVHWILFCLALLSKESAIVILPLSILYLVFVCERRAAWRRIGLLVVGYSGLVFGWIALRAPVLEGHAADLSLISLVGNLKRNSPLLLQYLIKLVIPYELSPVSCAEDTSLSLGLLALSIICLGLILTGRKNLRKIIFGTIWFLSFLIPSLIVPKITGLEHRVYVSFVGFLIVLSEIEFVRSWYRRLPYAVVSVMCIAAFAFVNVKHTPTFASRLAFWGRASKVSRHSALPFVNYGAALAEEGHLQEAVGVYREGIGINWREPMIHNNLAIALARMGRYDEAEAEFTRELSVKPRNIDVYYNLGVLYKTRGESAKAAEAWKHALTLNPEHRLAREGLEKLVYFERASTSGL